MIERTLGFVGAGTMAEALARGMLSAGAVAAESIFAADPSPERRGVFVEMVGENVFADNQGLVAHCEALVLCVKPNVLPAVADELAPLLTAEHLVISIAAGVTLGALEDMFGTDRLVRVMPNTPAQVAAGASAYCLGGGATEADAQLVERMLGAVGVCVRVPEEQMDAVTGLSGSGPAYVYLIIEALAEGGVRMGLPEDVAARLAAQTVLGAARMIIETGIAPDVLRDQVTTPGGTTEEGLRVLDEAGAAAAFAEAVKAAAEKSRALAARP